MKLIDSYESVLRQYCISNGLDYEKLKSLPRCGNEQVLYIQHCKKEKTGLGLKNSKPAEIVLTVEKKEDGTYDIAQGENAEKYLAI